MKISLVCISDAFGHVKGEIISDTKKVEEYLASEMSHHFIRTTAPEPAPEAAAGEPSAETEHPSG